MSLTEFPSNGALNGARWMYDQTVARVSLAFWTRACGRYYGLDFCRQAPGPVTPSGRGLSKPSELRKLASRGLISGQDTLLVGVGRGQEIGTWRRWKPRSVTTVELQDYRDDWKAAASPNGIPIRFTQGNACGLPFRDGSFDLAASFTVLEHVSPLDAHLEEMRRVLRPGAYYYAVFGPLWPTYGGCHVNSMEYRHLLLEDDELIDRARMAHDGEPEWLEKGLLNRLRYDDYLKAIGDRFAVEYEAWVLNDFGLRFRRERPSDWQTLTAMYDERDLLLSAVYLRLKKK